MGKKLVCRVKCYCGKLFYPGDVMDETELDGMSAMPISSKHWAREGSDEAFEASAGGEDKKDSLRNFLLAKNVTPPANATLKRLESMVAKLKAKPIAKAKAKKGGIKPSPDDPLSEK